MSTRWEPYRQHGRMVSAAVLTFGLANHLSDLVVQRELRAQMLAAQDSITELLGSFHQLRYQTALPVRAAADDVLEEAAALFGELPTGRPDAFRRALLPSVDQRWKAELAEFDDQLKKCGQASRSFGEAADIDLSRRRWALLRVGRSRPRRAASRGPALSVAFSCLQPT